MFIDLPSYINNFNLNLPLPRCIEVKSLTSVEKLYIPPKSIIRPSDPSVKMTKIKWTTNDKEEWLKSHIAEFSEAQANKTTSKFFFPAILKKWKKTWPIPEPTPEEITEFGSVEIATRKKRAIDEAVSLFTFYLMFTR